jgi:hypothetical protein
MLDFLQGNDSFQLIQTENYCHRYSLPDNNRFDNELRPDYRNLQKTVGRGSLSQITQTECFAEQIAYTLGDNPSESTSLLLYVRTQSWKCFPFPRNSTTPH